MPRAHFSRKKRKSRSRGSSAKRASRNRSQALKGKNRSSSVDVTSTSYSANEQGNKLNLAGDAIENSEPSASSAHKIPRESLILSLADNVATAAIATAEKVLKGSPHKKKISQKGTGKKSSQPSEETDLISISSKENIDSKGLSNSSTMVGEEDKLDNLCKLLDRLDGAYGKNSPLNSPLKVKKQNEVSNLNSHKKFDSPAKNSLNNVSPVKNSVCDSPAKKSTKDSPVKKALEPKISSNAADDEANLTQEEKLALRKAKKEAKKMGKQQKSQSDKKENLMNTSNLNLKPSSSLNDSNNISSIEDKKQEKSKADLRRERREKQEAQRASKEATKVAATTVAKSEVASNAKTEMEKEGNMIKKGPAKKKETLSLERHLPLLEHLSTHKSVQHELPLNSSTIHPAIRAMSLSMKDLVIDGCIARVVATLSAIYHLIEDYQTPPSCDLSRDLSSKLNNNIAFLNACRPISEPMNNAIRFVKREVNKVDSSVPERRAKEDLLEAIETYIHQNIVLASQAIIQNTLQFIEDNDVILTFGFSSLVYETVEAASKKCENLCVIVADNQGCPSGVDMLPLLVDLGVKVLYRVMPDLSQIIKKVTKVVVEAEAVVLNGAMIGRCGLAGTILLAASHSLPVVALSHTFKFCNIDLTDSLVVNELGSPAPIVDCPSSTYKQTLAQWKDTSSLNLVNLVYDVTPPRLISILVTERNAFPTSVVPVIIKRNYADILGQD